MVPPTVPSTKPPKPDGIVAGASLRAGSISEVGTPGGRGGGREGGLPPAPATVTAAIGVDGEGMYWVLIGGVMLGMPGSCRGLEREGEGESRGQGKGGQDQDPCSGNVVLRLASRSSNLTSGCATSCQRTRDSRFKTGG